MKDLDKIIIAFLYPLFGAFLGFLVFTFATGGWIYVFTGRARSTWLGPVGLWVCVGVGAVLAWIAYRKRQVELTGAEDFAASLDRDPLLKKRLVVVITCVVALYFLWQLAKTV